MTPTLEDAAAFVAGAGIALVHPQPDLVLPPLANLFGAAAGADWAIRDETGAFVDFTPEFGAVWRWKDELPERRLACAGRHLGRFVALVAPELVAAVLVLRRSEKPLDGLQGELAEAVREQGPCGAPELRRLLGADTKAVNRAVEALQRRCVLTSAGQVRQTHGWPAIRLELFERHWARALERLPAPEEARRTLALRVLAGAGEVSAADLAAALGWRQAEAAAALERLADEGAARVGDEGGIAVFAIA